MRSPQYNTFMSLPAGRFGGIPLAGLLIHLYVFMEWIFFVTRPSFMSSMTFIEQARILFLASFIFLVPTLVLSILLSLAFAARKTWIVAVVPAFIATCLALILFDNFTYTVFRFGIVHGQGIWRVLYAAAVLIVFLVFLGRFSTYLHHRHGLAWPDYLFLTLLSISGVIFILQIPQLDMKKRYAMPGSEMTLPIIIL